MAEIRHLAAAVIIEITQGVDPGRCTSFILPPRIGRRQFQSSADVAAFPHFYTLLPNGSGDAISTVSRVELLTPQEMIPSPYGQKNAPPIGGIEGRRQRVTES